MTALTIANTDILIYKYGSGAMVAKNSGGATHMSGGVYSIALDVTDCDTVGPMRIYVHMAGAIYLAADFQVMAANVFDSQVLGTANLTVVATEASIAAALQNESIATSTNVTDAQAALSTEIGNISGGMTEQGVRDALGYGAANHDAQVTALTDLINDIKGKTDQLAFTKTNELDVNVRSRNGAREIGSGIPTDKWRGG